MPLSELHAKLDAASKSKSPNCASALDPSPYTPDGEFVELLWENGQIVMQGGGGQSARPSTATARKTSLATMFPSISAKLQEKASARDETSHQRLTRFGGPADHLVGGIGSGNDDAAVLASTQMGGGGFGAQDDDLVPWVNCPFDDYYSELLGDFHGVNAVSSPLAHSNGGGSLVPGAAATDRGADAGFSMTVVRNPPVVELQQQQQQQQQQATLLKHPLAGMLTDTTARIRTAATAQFSQPPPTAPAQQWPSPIGSGRLNAPVDLGSAANSATTTTHTPAYGLLGPKLSYKQSLAATSTTKPPLPPQPPSSSSGIVNFSHFSRPSVLLKATNIHAADKNSTAATTSSNPMESTLVESSNTAMASGKGQPRLTPQPVQQLRSGNRLEHVAGKDTPATNDNNNIVFSGTPGHKDNTTKRLSSDQLNGKMAVAPERKEPEKPPDTVIASSSVCSGIGAGVSSNNDSRGRAKRKMQEGEESGYQSDDLEDESVGLKKPAAGRVKRSRAAEVHNLSERRRRDRINEKMRALQELIPNCNKVDKASMLDEAIEYLKTLQLQIQIMSMSNGMCMPPMVVPAGMQQLRQPHLAHMPHLGLGMGMGMGMGMGFGMGMVDTGGSPFMPVAPMQGPQFPCPMMSPTPGLQMFGMPTQGIPIRMPCGPPFPSLGAQPAAGGGGSSMPELPFAAASTGAMQALDMVPGCSGNNLNSDSGGNRQGSGDSEVPLTTQATTECGDQSASVQIMNQTSNSCSSGNGNSSTGTSYG